MPARYLAATPGEAMARHFRLLAQLDDSATLVSEWRPQPARRCTELTVVTRDAHGLVARLAGVLSAHGLDILSLDARTREDGLVLDTFRVREVPGAAAHAARAAGGAGREAEGGARGPLRRRRGHGGAARAIVAPPPARGERSQPSARFAADASAHCSVLEVRADDRPGLVYTLASTLAALGLDISFATLTTEKGQALDVFYVTDREGRTLEGARMRAVEDAVRQALDGGPSQGPAREVR